MYVKRESFVLRANSHIPKVCIAFTKTNYFLFTNLLPVFLPILGEKIIKNQ